VKIVEMGKNYNLLDPQNEIQRLRGVIEEIRMVANCYSEPEAKRLAVISQRCKDALAGGKP
jgi:hypothetical protein